MVQETTVAIGKKLVIAKNLLDYIQGHVQLVEQVFCALPDDCSCERGVSVNGIETSPAM